MSVQPNPEHFKQYVGNQTQVCSRFFRSEKSNDQWKEKPLCVKLFNELTESRTGNNPQNKAIIVKGLSHRAVVIADASSAQQNKDFAKVFDSSYRNQKGKLVEVSWSPEESLQISTPRGTHESRLTSVQKVGAHSNHNGDCRIDFDHTPGDTSYIRSHAKGSYDWILNEINQLTGNNPLLEKSIASLLLNHGKIDRQISFECIKEKLEIQDWTDAQNSNLQNMRNLLVSSSISVLQKVKTGIPFSDAVSQIGNLTEAEKNKVDQFSLLFQSFGFSEFPAKEKALASILLQNISPTRRYSPITKEDLELFKIEGSEKNIQFLNDLYGLLFIKEISRRLNPENRSIDLPYALCLVRGLKLVGEKVDNQTLSFRNIFDPKHGLLFFTKASFLSNNDTTSSVNWIHQLNDAYFKVFPNQREQLSQPKGMLNELSTHFGGASDTDEDGYDSF